MQKSEKERAAALAALGEDFQAEAPRQYPAVAAVVAATAPPTAQESRPATQAKAARYRLPTEGKRRPGRPAKGVRMVPFSTRIAEDQREAVDRLLSRLPNLTLTELLGEAMGDVLRKSKYQTK
jgi:hypothetical protein